jgi:CelD/BcsL family acetyltransferase involved in cellulose biosynthesis
VLRSPYLTLSGSYDDYLGTLDRKHVKELRRLRRRLEEQGQVTFDVADGSEDLDELLAAGFRIEVSGWKTAAGSAIASRPETLRFYREIARWAALRGWLRLGFLRVGGTPVAVELALEQDGVFYALKGGYDPQFRSFGPGMLITQEVLVRAFGLGLRRYEFLGAPEGYKLRWTSTTRELVTFHAFGRSPLGQAERAVWRVGRPLAKKMLALRRRLTH